MPSYLESLSKWIQLKIYQFEVTFSVYIFTPVEKFILCMFCSRGGGRLKKKKLTFTSILDSVLFLLFGLTFIATVLYLPHHVQFILNRAWFYMHGDAPELVNAGAQSLLATTAKVAEATVNAVREL